MKIFLWEHIISKTKKRTSKIYKICSVGKEYFIPLREYCVKIYDFDTMSSNKIVNKKLDDDIYREVDSNHRT